MSRAPGGVPERSKGSGCKPLGSAFGGSNPPPAMSVTANRGRDSCAAAQCAREILVHGDAKQGLPTHAVVRINARLQASNLRRNRVLCLADPALQARSLGLVGVSGACSVQLFRKPVKPGSPKDPLLKEVEDKGNKRVLAHAAPCPVAGDRGGLSSPVLDPVRTRSRSYSACRCSRAWSRRTSRATHVRSRTSQSRPEDTDAHLCAPSAGS
jgi:hypothetical protein